MDIDRQRATLRVNNVQGTFFVAGKCHSVEICSSESEWFAIEIQFKIEERNRVDIHSRIEDTCRHPAFASNDRAHSPQTRRASAAHPNANRDTLPLRFQFSSLHDL